MYAFSQVSLPLIAHEHSCGNLQDKLQHTATVFFTWCRFHQWHRSISFHVVGCIMPNHVQAKISVRYRHLLWCCPWWQFTPALIEDTMQRSLQRICGPAACHSKQRHRLFRSDTESSSSNADSLAFVLTSVDVSSCRVTYPAGMVPSST